MLTQLARRLSLQGKFLLLSFVTSTAALLLAVTIFTVYQLAAARADRSSELRLLVAVLADHAGRVLGGGSGSAAATLDPFREHASIASASLVGRDGRLIASYRRPDRGRAFWPLRLVPGERVERPVFADGAEVGTLTVQGALAPAVRRAARDAAVGALVMLASFLVAVIVSRGVQGVIRGQLGDLARRARAVLPFGEASPSLEHDELDAVSNALSALASEIDRQTAATIAREQHFHALLEHGSDGVVELDAGGTVRYVTRAAAQVLGPCVGIQVLEEGLSRVHAQDRAALREALRRPTRAGDEARPVIFRSRREPGTVPEPDSESDPGSGPESPTQWLTLEARAIRANDVDGGSVVVNLRDVTTRERANEALESAQGTLLEANGARSRIVAAFNHEVRTPLTAVVGMADLLARSELRPEQARWVEIARASAESLLGLIDDVLKLSWASSGEASSDSLDFDLLRLVEQVADVFALRAHSKGLELSVLVDSDIPRRLRGDPGHLRQVLVHLLSNAVKFTDRGGVHLQVDAVAAHEGSVVVRIRVRDTGIGIPESMRDELFHVFVGIDGTTGGRPGIGVGLAVAQALVALMGGRIGVEPDAGGGTAIWVEIELERREQGGAAPGSGLAGRSVLVVGQDAGTRASLIAQLRTIGAEITIATDRRHGLDALTSGSFDLTLVDQILSGTSGLELVIEARDAAPAVATRFGLLVRLTDRLDPSLLARAGIAGLLPKPIRQTDFAQRVAELLDPETMPATRNASRAAVPEGHPPRRLLLADDQPEVREALTVMLTALGHEVVTAADSCAAITAVAEERYDVVLLDLHLTPVDGLSATRAIRSLSGKRGQVPVVGLNGFALKGEREAALAAGMNDVITKPVSLERLESAVAQHS